MLSFAAAKGIPKVQIIKNVLIGNIQPIVARIYNIAYKLLDTCQPLYNFLRFSFCFLTTKVGQLSILKGNSFYGATKNHSNIIQARMLYIDV